MTIDLDAIDANLDAAILHRPYATMRTLVAELRKARAAAPEIEAERVRLVARVAELERALRRIEKWFGEFPPSERHWPDGAEMSYGIAFGSNGERDYMRTIARAALGPTP